MEGGVIGGITSVLGEIFGLLETFFDFRLERRVSGFEFVFACRCDILYGVSCAVCAFNSGFWCLIQRRLGVGVGN